MMFANDLNIVKDYMTAFVKIAHWNKLHEIDRDNLMSAVYPKLDDATGRLYSIDTETVAIDLAELSNVHAKRLKPYKRQVKAFKEVLETLTEQEKAKLYYAVNNQDELFTDETLQLVIMQTGTYIQDNYMVVNEDTMRDERERYINKLIEKGITTNDKAS